MAMKIISVTDIGGFKLGNAENSEKGTGCTVIVCEEGAVGGVDVRGGGPATRETDLLRSENTVNAVNAVVLSGGSAFGLEAASGVMRELAEMNVGFDVGDDITVPIVCGASLYDLPVGDHKAFPDVNMGMQAVRNAYSGSFAKGNHGAGTGATVGKMKGYGRAMKSGLGTFACGDGVVEVGAIAAVNAVGDIYNGAGNIIAGLRSEDGQTIYGTIKTLKSMVHDNVKLADDSTSFINRYDLDEALAAAAKQYAKELSTGKDHETVNEEETVKLIMREPAEDPSYEIAEAEIEEIIPEQTAEEPEIIPDEAVGEAEEEPVSEPEEEFASEPDEETIEEAIEEVSASDEVEEIAEETDNEPSDVIIAETAESEPEVAETPEETAEETEEAIFTDVSEDKPEEEVLFEEPYDEISIPVASEDEDIVTEPAAEAQEEPVEETVEEPVTEAQEEPAEETVEETVAEPQEEPVEEPVEEITEEYIPETPEANTADDFRGYDEISIPVASDDEETVTEPAAEAQEEPVEETVEEPVVLTREDMGYDIVFNTTISCLITNAALTKSQANKLASILHDAYARAIKPVHGTLDGDTVFVLATGKQQVNFDAFAALATDVMQYAIIDGATSAEGAYGLPSARDMQKTGV